MTKTARACRLRREGQERGAIAHQVFVGCVRTIPLEHREGGVVQRAPFAITEYGRDGEDALSPAASSFLQANSGEVWR